MRVFADRLRLEGRRQGARTKDVDQVVDLLLGEVAADLAVHAIADLIVGRRHDQAVQDDGQVPEKPSLRLVLVGHVKETISAFGVEGEVHRQTALFVGRFRGIAQELAGDFVVGNGFFRVAGQDKVFDFAALIPLGQFSSRSGGTSRL